MDSKPQNVRQEPAVVTTVKDIREAVRRARGQGRTIGFVPTMGALHRGHVSLIEASTKDRHWTVVSIYVNPTQFGPNEDFAKYPRTFDADRDACRSAGAELIFVPQDPEIYPPGDQTRVIPGALAETMCGLSRPGHFVGVCTVVAKLFNIVQPDVAYFGRKDAQQALIIQRMVRDLHMPINIVLCPLIRERDGLAMSSRNTRLDTEQRAQALCLHKALCRGRDDLKSGETSTGRIIAAMRATAAEIAPAAVIDYLTIVDPQTLAPIVKPTGRVMIAGAVRVGDVRLIDNILVDLP
ncbi:MAG TPA: pantoate--beta-alanine ligase [Phycisphaerae bacterium]|nr:pantoate--beta-alanine ligase [Phycisphaerae bacterium]